MKATITINGYDDQGLYKPIATVEIPYYGDPEDLMEFSRLADKLARAMLRFVNGFCWRIVHADEYYWLTGGHGDYQLDVKLDYEETTNGQS